MKLVLTGVSGLVGGDILAGLARQFNVLAPFHNELDITKANAVTEYFGMHRPEVVIHAAALTNNDAAEKERGDEHGVCWQVNVEGTRHVVDAAKRVGAMVLFISTGSVFAGDEVHPGPFIESDPTSGQENLSWYACTKAVAETLISDGIIIRLSHPVAQTPIFLPDKHDYIHNLVSLYDSGRLYPLFTDQLFPISYLPDVAIAIKQILQNPASHKSKIYHMVSIDSVSPYELTLAALEKARYVRPHLATTTFDAFIKTVSNPKRYTKYSAIDGSVTRKTLNNPARTWQEIVDCLYPKPSIY